MPSTTAFTSSWHIALLFAVSAAGAGCAPLAQLSAPKEHRAYDAERVAAIQHVAIAPLYVERGRMDSAIRGHVGTYRDTIHYVAREPEPEAPRDRPIGAAWPFRDVEYAIPVQETVVEVLRKVEGLRTMSIPADSAMSVQSLRSTSRAMGADAILFVSYSEALEACASWFSDEHEVCPNPVVTFRLMDTQTGTLLAGTAQMGSGAWTLGAGSKWGEQFKRALGGALEDLVALLADP